MKRVMKETVSDQSTAESETVRETRVLVIGYEIYENWAVSGSYFDQFISSVIRIFLAVCFNTYDIIQWERQD